jgi:hypothetical protein
VVAHHVSLIAVQAQAAGALLSARPAEASRSADAIAATARQAMTELRRLLGVLRFSAADQGPSPERTRLTPAPSLSRLDDLLTSVRASGLPVTCTVSGAEAALTPGVDLTAYRIVQEALTNALRHAPGSAASVALTYENACLSVAVTNTSPKPPQPQPIRPSARPPPPLQTPPSLLPLLPLLPLLLRRPAATAWPGSPSGLPPAAARSPSARPPTAVSP